jgi:hypothetical protein
MHRSGAAAALSKAALWDIRLAAFFATNPMR